MNQLTKWVWGGPIALVAAVSVQAFAQPPEFTHELWGRTFYGDGYVYGPPYRSSGVAVVDIDVDGDNDFALPAFRTRRKSCATSEATDPFIRAVPAI